VDDHLYWCPGLKKKTQTAVRNPILKKIRDFIAEPEQQIFVYALQ